MKYLGYWVIGIVAIGLARQALAQTAEAERNIARLRASFIPRDPFRLYRGHRQFARGMETVQFCGTVTSVQTTITTNGAAILQSDNYVAMLSGNYDFHPTNGEVHNVIRLDYGTVIAPPPEWESERLRRLSMSAGKDIPKTNVAKGNP